MDKKYILELFYYNFQVNRRILTILDKSEATNEQSLRLLSHLLTAERIWLMRLQGKDISEQIIWPELPPTGCKKLLTENQMAYIDYLKNISDNDLSSDLIYKNSKGIEFHTPVIDILMHVIIHGGYHRGQIAAAIRQAGGEPVNTDYIYYVRFMKSNGNL